MRTITIPVYKIEDHPNPEKVYDWIRENWYDLAQFDIDELVASLKALHQKIGGELKYSISAFPDRGEYISFRDYDKNILRSIRNDTELTMSTYDMTVINGVKKGRMDNILDELHLNADYIYSDEGLEELCEANDYEFYEDGSLCHL